MNSSRNAATQNQSGTPMDTGSVGTTVVVRMNRAPEVHRDVDERHVGHAEERQPRRQLVRPGPPYCRRSRYATATIQPIRLDVSRTSHCHQTPQALRAHSGPVTSVSSAEEHRQLRGRAARSGRCRGSPLKRYRALATPHTTAADQEHPGRRHVVVENLLHQPHRRLVRRARDDERGRREHQAAQHHGGCEPFRHKAAGLTGCGLRTLALRHATNPNLRA